MQKKTNYSCDILLAKQKKTIEKIRDLLLESDENDTKTLEELQEKEDKIAEQIKEIKKKFQGDLK